ncbi:MAG: hypothetical protein WCL50_16720, partial [Spirochaetota bacterium]
MVFLFVRAPSQSYEIPLLLAALNSLFLCLIPLGLAYLAAQSHKSTGALGFLLMGCGLVFFGVSGLYAGWVMPLAQGPNPTVTLHNIGALLAGICEVLAAQLFLKDVTGMRQPGHRLLDARWLYSGIVMLVSIIAIMSFRGVVPIFFDATSGPSLLRQLVLGSAALLFFLAGGIFAQIHSLARTAFAFWYSLALRLISIGFAGVLVQPGVGSAIGWAGRSAQYVGCLFFIVAFLQGRWERKGLDKGLEATWSFWPFLEQRIEERTTELMKANDELAKEVAARKAAETDLRAVFDA